MVDPAHPYGNPRLSSHRTNVLPTINTMHWASRFQRSALTCDIEIDYAALSLAVPQKVQFRYELEGHDASWQDVGTRRQAFYTNLSPGNYRFRVVACNNSGVWNEAGTFLDFSIAPATL